MVFCTLFDSNYLDKGLVMYRSLLRVTNNFKIYVLAMDDNCYKILSSYNYPNMIVIDLSGFIKGLELEKAQNNRSRGEFCWTCTPFLIYYVLTKFNEKICTYLDADLFFYSNPKVLIDEMGEKTVQIIEHRYNSSIMGRHYLKKSGRYCVQFNTFKKTQDAIELLRWWMDKCLSSCSNSANNKRKGTVLGDQGYLEDWGEKGNVSIIQNLGGGVAPWNIARYTLQDERNLALREKSTGHAFNLIFYHFHNIRYINRYKVNITIFEYWKTDKRLIEKLYLPYLTELDKTKEELKEKFNIFPLLADHPAIRKDEVGDGPLATIKKARLSLKNDGIIYTLYMGITKRERDREMARTFIDIPAEQIVR